MKLGEKRLVKNKQNVSELWDNIKQHHICVEIECQRKGERLKNYLKRYKLKISKLDEN